MSKGMNWSRAKKSRSVEGSALGRRASQELASWSSGLSERDRELFEGKRSFGAAQKKKARRKKGHHSPERARAIQVWKERMAVPEDDVRQLLHQVLMQVITTGHEHLLRELPDVLHYMGGHLPTVREVMGREPEAEEIEGTVRGDDVVYKFTCLRWPKAFDESQLTPPEGWLG